VSSAILFVLLFPPLMKLKIGIIFGGFSKEREISFAGGRTVYDNLNKSIFEAVPVFVDSFGNFVLLNWEFIYKGSIRDFLPAGNEDFQLYAESLGKLSEQQQEGLILAIGKRILPSELKTHFDFAFLCLHGAYGEDGRIQGLLEYLKIPYSGSGILPSAIGMDKAEQKKFMQRAGFRSPSFFTLSRQQWTEADMSVLFEKAKKEIGLPLVIKAAHQGSSIGISILQEDSLPAFSAAVDQSFFVHRLAADKWETLSPIEKTDFIRVICDIREGIGIPMRIGKEIFYQPAALKNFVDANIKTHGTLLLESLEGESDVLIEGFISGREFSCIVIQDEHGKPVALPPTEIRKGKEMFDYRSKYLPGLSRKITPIDLPDSVIKKIRTECESLFLVLAFDVYARIDGFINEEGQIFLNDPNTTSGMMPSSFFFHQAAEIGLNPSQFLTFIIRTSLHCRIEECMGSGLYDPLLFELDRQILKDQSGASTKLKVGVLFGGYSSERHISVESGRNVYEKLSSSDKYEPIPVFLTGNNEEHIMYRVPVSILLKDNADDIREKIEKYHVHPAVQEIITRCASITKKYAGAQSFSKPIRLSYEDLSGLVGAVFIALHGRPGEDGAVQEKLEQLGLAYNGSDQTSSGITIDKYRTTEILRQNGMLVAEHMLVTEEDWLNSPEKVKEQVLSRIHLPFIAKPVDDGCSSAVKKIKSFDELEAFASLIFRKSEGLIPSAAATLHIKPKEEFPLKKVFLIEELISKKNAKHFLEVTGGMLTRFNSDGKPEYEVFEASEALSEGEVLSLEEKFLAGQGQNITPARYSPEKEEREKISAFVKTELGKAAKVLGVTGYCRIDAFVRVFENGKSEVIFIEVNSLPGMTPATCIFHQAAISHYKPYDFIDKILDFGLRKKKKNHIPL
jgi:UDP-N-acetylmuramate--alanine ligase